MFTSEKQGAVAVVVPAAALTDQCADEFTEFALGCVGVGRPMLAIDLRAVPHIDSAGLEALLDLQDRVRVCGGAVKLAAPNPLLRDVLRATGVGERFQVFSTLKSAVGSFSA